MTNEQKKQIITAANNWLQQHSDISQNKLASMCGINSSYLSNMLAGKLFTMSAGKKVLFADKWFLKIAETIGVSVEKVYWDHVHTVQFKQIYTALVDAKETGGTKMLIGDTGCGKTNTIEFFCKKNPTGTMLITVSSLYKLHDIVNELAEKAGLQVKELTRSNGSSMKYRVDAIIKKIKDLKLQGKKPLLIFDEGENMEFAVLKMLKGLYDALKDHCGIVLIGTDQLITKLTNSKKRNREAMPQLYRRFEAGLTNISPIEKNRDYTLILEKHVEDKGLRKLLTDICDNYGVLHDRLKPALKEADERGIQLTEQFFRTKYNMHN